MSKKIMFLTHRDARDKREWSGTMYYMAQSLDRNAGQVIYAGPYYPKLIFILLKIINKISIIIFRKKYKITYSYLLSLVFKRFFTKKIKKENPDIVLAVSASGEASQLKVDCPVIYLGDATFNLLIDRYNNFTNLSRFSRWEANIVENKVFSNASALVFSSEWAARSAIEEYKVPQEKIHIVSYGANMEKIPSIEQVQEKKIDETLKILFLAVDWERKGGDTVFKAFIELQNRGINAELTVCGCEPPEHYRNPKMKVIPFLNKNDKKDAETLYEIFMDSNFLFVPSKSDCTPIVFCEANAFGIPVITTNAGGISSVITEGVNGHMLNPEDDFNKYADILSSYTEDEPGYRKLVKSSRERHDKYLNWDTWGKSLNKLMTDLLKDNTN